MEPSKKTIEAELDKILAAPQIAKSRVLSAFLKYIVHETLEGRSDELKEYTIAIDVLKREEDFNPQVDSIVRIHAGRLRRTLKEYYYEEGRENALKISIPKGGYIPAFTLNAKVKPDNTALVNDRSLEEIFEKEEKITKDASKADDGVFQKISLTVLPFRHIGHGEEGGYFAQSISEYIRTELSMFEYVSVFSYPGNMEAARAHNLMGGGAGCRSDYMLTGSIQFHDNLVRIWVRLTTKSGEELWGHTFKNEDTHQSLWEFQDTIVAYVIAHVMGLNGVMLRDKFAKVTDENNVKNPLMPLYWYLQYDANYNEYYITKAKAFFNKLIVKAPDNALAHACLSLILMGEYYFFPKEHEENIALSYVHGKLALKSNPSCQQAYVAMSVNYLNRHQKNSCIDILEQGLKVHPGNFDYQNAMGAILVCVGEFERAGEFLHKNFLINPHLLWWQKKVYTYYLFHRKEYEKAVFLAEQVNFGGAWRGILKTAAYAQLGLKNEAYNALSQLKVACPQIDFSGPEGLRPYFCSEDFISELMEGLNKLNREAVK